MIHSTILLYFSENCCSRPTSTIWVHGQDSPGEFPPKGIVVYQVLDGVLTGVPAQWFEIKKQFKVFTVDSVARPIFRVLCV